MPRFVTKTLQAHVEPVAQFLNQIGLRCTRVPKTRGLFPGVHIMRGCLCISPMAHVSDLLHEAGHLAIMPGRLRHLAGRNIDNAIAAMVKLIDFSDPDAPEARALIQAGDCEATAWAWAAGIYLGLNPDEVIRDADYENRGASIRVALGANAYFGINGLAHAGFCVTRPGPLEVIRGLPAYPKLAMWIQPGVGQQP